ncbi:MAG TPA: hypothetical protein VM884_08635 [Flavisolibacter sp.]|nr:hypothetical protein [Flavisolibacter sp.]
MLTGFCTVIKRWWRRSVHGHRFYPLSWSRENKGGIKGDTILGSSWLGVFLVAAKRTKPTRVRRKQSLIVLPSAGFKIARIISCSVHTVFITVHTTSAIQAVLQL